MAHRKFLLGRSLTIKMMVIIFPIEMTIIIQNMGPAGRRRQSGSS